MPLLRRSIEQIDRRAKSASLRMTFSVVDLVSLTKVHLDACIFAWRGGAFGERRIWRYQPLEKHTLVAL
jgi:hypothetical protein